MFIICLEIIYFDYFRDTRFNVICGLQFREDYKTDKLLFYYTTLKQLPIRLHLTYVPSSNISSRDEFHRQFGNLSKNFIVPISYIAAEKWNAPHHLFVWGFFSGGRAASQFTFPICRECALAWLVVYDSLFLFVRCDPYDDDDTWSILWYIVYMWVNAPVYLLYKWMEIYWSPKWDNQINRSVRMHPNCCGWISLCRSNCFGLRI